MIRVNPLPVFHPRSVVVRRLGVLIGAARMQTTRIGLNLLGFPTYWQPAAIGAVIFFAIMFDRWQKLRSTKA